MFVLREEEHTHTVFPLAANVDVQLVGDLGEEFVADLEQNAHAVAGFALGVLAGAVFQMLHDGQRIADRLVAFAAFDIHHGADAAGIVLKPGIIQADRRFAFGKLIHFPFPSYSVMSERQRRGPLLRPAPEGDNKKALLTGIVCPSGTPLFPYLYYTKY